MDRRQVLKLAAILAAGAGLPAHGARGMRVVVAGAGIVGASIAHELARSGAQVTVIDGSAPASHASRGTFAWINATWAKQPRHYHRLNQESVADWHELQNTLQLPVSWGGSLEWFATRERQAKLSEQVAEQQAWGEPARMVNADEVEALEPGLRFVSYGMAAYSPNDGAVDPVLATQKLLQAAEALGASVIYPSELQDVVLAEGRLVAVKTSTGTLNADRLVLATGAAEDLPGRITGIDIPQRSTPGIIGITEPLPPLLNSVVAAPGVHMHQRSDGRFVIGEQEGAPQSHGERLAERPNDFPSRALVMEHGDRLLLAARRFLPALEKARIENVYIGWRPLPLDGHPVLGVNPDRPHVYLAIMHSGVSLAPLVGRLVARELAGNNLGETMDPYRPTREFARVRRY